MAYFDTDNATYNASLRKIETTDKVHADIVNAAYEQLINNDVAIMAEITAIKEALKNVIATEDES